MTADLTITTQLEECETVIERGMRTFMEVGQALAKVRDERLYRDEYATFEVYCERRWNLSRTRAYAAIDAANVVSRIRDIGAPEPQNQGQAEALSGLEPETAAEVMRDAHEHNDGRVTATAIRDARERIAPKPRPIADLPPAANLAQSDLDALNAPALEPTSSVVVDRDADAVEPEPTPDTFECDGCAGEFAELNPWQNGFLCDACFDRDADELADTMNEPQPEPEHPSALEIVANDPEVQNTAYMAEFYKSLTSSDKWLRFDAERIGHICDNDDVATIEHHIKSAQTFLDTMRRARSGLRVVNGGKR